MLQATNRTSERVAAGVAAMLPDVPDQRTVAAHTAESRALVEDIQRAQSLVERLNTISVTDAEALGEAFAELTGRPVPAGFRLVPPFRTDYGGRCG